MNPSTCLRSGLTLKLQGGPVFGMVFVVWILRWSRHTFRSSSHCCVGRGLAGDQVSGHESTGQTKTISKRIRVVGFSREG